jgi:hypothetical protein
MAVIDPIDAEIALSHGSARFIELWSFERANRLTGSASGADFGIDQNDAVGSLLNCALRANLHADWFLAVVTAHREMTDTQARAPDVANPPPTATGDLVDPSP